MEEEDEDEGNKPISEEPRKSSREKVPNKRFEDYELYVTVAEEDEFLLATNGEESEEKEIENAMMSNEVMSAVAHSIMVHYAKKELIKKRKKKYKPKDGQYTLDAGLRKFGDEGKTAVMKELCQFNTYNIFELLEANSLSNKEKKGTLSSLIFLKEIRNGTVKA